MLTAGPASAGASACRPDLVQARVGKDTVTIKVERATTEAKRQRGLMGRRALAPGHGMLFVYRNPVRVSYWMKGTLIPLDILFADRTGRVTRVYPRAVPGDLTLLDGGAGVKAVLEIAGGEAARLGLGPGTVLRNPAFAVSVAAWPCR